MESNDSGGVAAKHGFLFQDCVAAYHVTRMLRDKTIRSVRCEVTDDIDIVSDGYIDFVQVKKHRQNTLEHFGHRSEFKRRW
ncbi:hypothetical protein DZS_08800 [Dickeya ananatis]